MGASSSTVAQQYAEYRVLFEERQVEAIAAKFGSSGLVHFYNVQDRQPLVFKGKEQIEGFFKHLVKVFPFCSFELPPNDDAKDELDLATTAIKERLASKRDEAEVSSTSGASELAEKVEPAASSKIQSEDSPIAIDRVVIGSHLFDNTAKVAIVEYKIPKRGYRFVQETLQCSGSDWTLLSITMDSATDFSSLQ
mmetsp:Transcript_24052/g.42453  ORF Transcript_24052/g.42453 Transcript_24052/m.42453 type:complete len:194 (-) Transcript_24052:314-895(-)